MVRRLGSSEYDRRVRRAILITIAVVAFLRGWAYLGPAAPDTGDRLAFLDGVVPLPVWAGVWVFTGVIALIGLRVAHVARLAMSFSVGLWGVWAISYFVAWVFAGESNAWVNAVPLAGFAFLIAIVSYLMEPPPRVREGPG